MIEIIDNALGTSKHRQVSFGQLFLAMMINGLGFTGRTLHMYSQYFQDKPLERLIGPGLEPEWLNDDALHRMVVHLIWSVHLVLIWLVILALPMK